MIKALRVGNTVICSINNKMYKKTTSSTEELMELYEKVLNTDEENKEEVKNLIEFLTPKKTIDEIQQEIQQEIKFEKEQKEVKEQEDILTWMQQIRDNGNEYFEVLGNKLFMKDINITIPEFLALEFTRRKDNEEDLFAMMNFWRRCALNPDPRCREDLYKFLINNDLSITSAGYFVAYRNANVKQEGDRKFNETIIEAWTKLKSQKRGPRNYELVFQHDKDDQETGEYQLCKPEYDGSLKVKFEHWRKIGNVQELYDGLSEKNDEQTIYTDAYSGTTTIIIGKPVSIDRSKCDANPDQTCSNGLHLGSTNFMSKGYFGQVGLICLCDPMKVVAVPYSDGQKLRTSEYLPVGITEYDDNNKIIPVETSIFEFDYASHTQEELEKMINNSHLESLKEHEIIPKEMSLFTLKNITKELKESLNKINEIVNNRIKNV